MERALRAADAAGDVPAATQLAQAIRNLSAEQQFMGPVATGEEMAQSFPAAPKKPGLIETARLSMTPTQRLGLGAGEAALSIGSGMVAAPLNHLWNAGMEALEFPTGQPVSTYQPKTEEGQSLLSGVDKTMRLTGIPQALEKGMDLENPDAGVRATGNLIGAGLGLIPAVGPMRNARARRAAIPTREEIKAASGQAYQRAEQAGGMLPQNSLGGFVTQAEQILAKEGVDAALHPKTMAAFNRLMEDATKPGIAGHSVQGAETLRRVLSNAETEAIAAAGGQVSSDARLAAQLLDEFDDFIDQQLPTSSAEYQTARTLWQTQRKAQDIEQLFERAKNQAGQYSVSGMENALRTQFKQLADNPRRFRRFSEDERAAILQVVRGGPIQNALRLVGKFAPTGTVPAIASLAAEGVTPGLGLGLAATGLAGRAGASALRTRSAMRADELVRSKAIPAMGPSRRPGSEPLPQLGYLPSVSLGTEETRRKLIADQLRR